MAGGWRYYTTPDCVRHWRWFAKVGPAEAVRAVLPACVKAGALALPLLAGPAAAPLPARVLPAPLPLIGQPDAFGGGAYALGGPGYGLGGVGYAPIEGVGPSGFGGAGYGYAGEGSGALVPGAPPAVGTAYAFNAPAAGQVPGNSGLLSTGSAGLTTPQTDVSTGVASSGTSQPVPEPASLTILALAVGAAVLLRGKNGGGSRMAVLPRRATSKHGATHA